jgi:BlaI family penicillinase repressor
MPKELPGVGGPALSPLEHDVMEIVWRAGSATADDVRDALTGRDLKNATVRTLLRRIEEKGYLAHKVEGRAFVYTATKAPSSEAVGAVRRIVDRFCGGSVEQLLVGLLEARVVDPAQLEALSKKVARARDARRGGKKRSRG